MNSRATRLPASLKSLLTTSTRSLAAQAAPRPSPATLAGSDVQWQTLPNGIGIGTIDTGSPISSITVLVRGGSRAEDETNLGASHALRASVGLSTRSTTSFLITRNITQTGCSLTGTSTREYTATTLTGIRENVESNVSYLFESAVEPAFKPWELHDSTAPRMKLERALLKQNPSAQVVEALHRAAFRNGLGNSLYAAGFRIGSLIGSPDVLNGYLQRSLSPGNVFVLGTGVGAKELARWIDFNVSLPKVKGQGAISSGSERGFLGKEVRIDTASPITHVALASEGVPAGNTKERLALQLFATALGNGNSAHLPYSSGASLPLGAAVAKVASEPAAVSALNINYSDTGLFGIRLACSPRDAGAVTKAAVSALRSAAKSISDKELSAAKCNLKARLIESGDGDAALLAYLTEETGAASGPSAVLTPSELARSVDSMTVQDVQTVAGRVVKSRGALAAVGRLHNVPHLDELV